MPRQVPAVRESAAPDTTANGCVWLRLLCPPPEGLLLETDSRFLGNPEKSNTVIIESDILVIYAGSFRCLWQQITYLTISSSSFPLFVREGAYVVKQFLAVNSPKNHKGNYKSAPLNVKFILPSPIHIVTCLSVRHLKVTCHQLLDFTRKLSNFSTDCFLLLY